GNQNRLASFTFHQFACVVGILVFFEIDDRDLCALARHGDRDGAPDPAVSAGDERYLVLQLADARMLWRVIRLRPHLAFNTRLMVLLLSGHRGRGHGTLRTWYSESERAALRPVPLRRIRG